MSTKQKFNVHFYANKKKVKEGKVQLYVRIVVNQRRAEFATSYFIQIKYWNEKQRKVKTSHQQSHLINAYIDKTLNEINQIFFEESAKGTKLSSRFIKEKYLGIGDTAPTHKSIMDAFDYHNTKMEEQVEIGKVVKKTHTRYRITKNKIEAFMQHQYNLDDMPLPDLRLRFVTEFEHYLLTEENLQTNTAHKYIKNLKKIMNMSVGLDWIPSNPFNNFRCSYTAPDREVLTQEELDVIRLKKIDTPRLAEVRDVFVFCCYTGFAYSDIYKFDYHAVTKRIDGDYWLSTSRQKTGSKESVPLLPIALDIIKKYRDHQYCIEADKLLPVNSNQRYNGYLKEIAAICGIKKKITSHIARHTFATTVTLANGVPIETVSAMLGHNSIRTTQIYAKVVEKKVSDDMQTLKAKLFGAVPEEKQERNIG